MAISMPRHWAAATNSGSGFESLQPWIAPFGERRTPVRSGPATFATASVTSRRSRTRFSMEPPYWSVRWLVPSRRNSSIR